MTLIEQIKKHANEHYADEFAWSVIVECYEDSDLAELIERYNVRSLNGFIKKHAPIIEIYEDRIADARNSAF